ncbi:uncharacterized protein BJ171DRAFT_472680 [Polychytrium aggregatum]|uniref:uncharacterized protein n=1 Tax=Polychytrium aggregatum TaxID=110093 RepID=UPI0022FDD0C6|nr:uncharacterized protein BJ171DRAFT_472680 [Polychytrium aggregatum]KAI9207272.1 hypothetical protein BJ171DRAFT_472680 [Polychytrium aggregatum]
MAQAHELRHSIRSVSSPESNAKQIILPADTFAAMVMLNPFQLSTYIVGITTAIYVTINIFVLVKFSVRTKIIPQLLFASVFIGLIESLCNAYAFALEPDDCTHHWVAAFAYWLSLLFSDAFVCYKCWIFCALSGIRAKVMIVVAILVMVAYHVLEFYVTTQLHLIMVPMNGLSVCIPVFPDVTAIPLRNAAILCTISDFFLGLLYAYEITKNLNRSRMLTAPTAAHTKLTNLKIRGSIATILIMVIRVMDANVRNIAGDYIMLPILIDHAAMSCLAVFSVYSEDTPSSDSTHSSGTGSTVTATTIKGAPSPAPSPGPKRGSMRIPNSNSHQLTEVSIHSISNTTANP